jgi:pyruvate formate lyase activating enzyme
MTQSPSPTERAARWWHREGDRLVCDLCPRECRLAEGQRGFCFVRQNLGGEMVLTTYGRSTGFCIDPIEKKPLNHFLPGTPVLSFGTAGCNLGCKFCQNWDISKSREIEILSAEAGPATIVEAAKALGCRSIAFTYNDPVIWAECAIDTAKIARAEGIKTVAVTAGYISAAARPEFFEPIDAANVDLKAFTEEFYRSQTVSHLQPVLDTLEWLKNESSVWFEITNLMIPGENDSHDETARLCDWIAEHLGPDVPLHFTAFHPDFKMRDKEHTPLGTLIGAREIALARGLNHVYLGNVLDGDRQSTVCPGCVTVVIERVHYEIGAYRIRDGACANCGTTIPGVFENTCGSWGRKRQPVDLRDWPGLR